MSYKIIESALNSPIDLDRIERTANYYSNGRFHLEIYENGTCIFPPVAPDNVPQSGRSLLTALGTRNVDFTVREMDDHNFVVRFSESVSGIVFSDDFNDHKAQIGVEYEQSSASEALLGRADAPREHVLIGLYARTRLLQDIENPVLARSIAPAR